MPSFSTQRENKTTFIYKIIFNTESIKSFQKNLYETDCEETENSKNQDKAYTTVLQKAVALYDNYFPKEKIKLKAKDLKRS